ncbi:hypothetical protein Tco_1317999 [Tanacetum coccineum]
MGDEHPIRTLGDCSRPSHEGNRTTIELPDENNVVPLRSNTIRLVQNGCSFHRLQSEDPNQHLKDFLKLVESLDLDVANRERMGLRRTAKLCNEILMFLTVELLKSTKCFEIEEKVGGEFSGSETVVKETKSRDLEQNNLGNRSHVMDFTILENVKANIDPNLTQLVFGRPFMEITGLISDREQGLITFTNGIKEVTFKTPYRDPEMNDLTSEGHDLLSSRLILSEDDYRRACEMASDLESRFYVDVDKLNLSYKEETDRINLVGSF